jgi:HEPN domain-containing protein
MSEHELGEPIRYWLELAFEDLAAARYLAADPTLAARLAAGHAQQAAEKALKAVIVASGREPPRSHDLVALAHGAQGVVSLTVDEDALRSLTDAHMQSRYPEPRDPGIDAAAASSLVEIAALLVAQVQGALWVDPIEPTVPLFDSGPADLAERADENLTGFGDR